MKKNLLRVLSMMLAVLLIFPLASCGGDDDTDPSPSTPASTEPSHEPSIEPTPAPVYVTEYIGTVYNVSSFLRVRSGPGTGYDVIGEALAGDKFTVLEQNVDGGVWHKISYGGIEGFVHGDYLTIDEVQVEVID